jgi:hypothetical protein
VKEVDARTVVVTAAWSDPVAGSCTDTFQLSEDGMFLTQETLYVREQTGESA